MKEFVKELINCVINNAEVTKAGGITISIACNEEIEHNINMYANQLVIEELNSIASFCQGSTEEELYKNIINRIIELK